MGAWRVERARLACALYMRQRFSEPNLDFVHSSRRSPGSTTITPSCEPALPTAISRPSSYSANNPSHVFRQITQELKTAGIPVFPTTPVNRTAFRAIFIHRLDLDELDPQKVSGLEAARANAQASAQDVVDLIRRTKATEQTHAA